MLLRCYLFQVLDLLYFIAGDFDVTTQHPKLFCGLSNFIMKLLSLCHWNFA